MSHLDCLFHLWFLSHARNLKFLCYELMANFFSSELSDLGQAEWTCAWPELVESSTLPASKVAETESPHLLKGEAVSSHRDADTFPGWRYVPNSRSPRPRTAVPLSFQTNKQNLSQLETNFSNVQMNPKYCFTQNKTSHSLRGTLIS